MPAHSPTSPMGWPLHLGSATGVHQLHCAAPLGRAARQPRAWSERHRGGRAYLPGQGGFALAMAPTLRHVLVGGAVLAGWALAATLAGTAAMERHDA